MTDLITRDLVRLDADLGTDKHDVIRALAQVVADGGRSPDPDQLAADAITRDLAYGLRTSLSQAQQIKENYGVAMGNMVDKSEGEISFTAMDGRIS